MLHLHALQRYSRPTDIRSIKEARYYHLLYGIKVWSWLTKPGSNFFIRVLFQEKRIVNQDARVDKRKRSAYLLLHGANLLFSLLLFQVVQLRSPAGTATTKFITDRGRQQKPFWEAALQEPTALDRAISRQRYSNTTIFCREFPFPRKLCTSALFLHHPCHWFPWRSFQLPAMRERVPSNIHSSPITAWAGCGRPLTWERFSRERSPKTSTKNQRIYHVVIKGPSGWNLQHKRQN